MLDAAEVACDDPDCPIRTAVLAPVISDDRVVAALGAYGPAASAGLVRATEEVARWASTQVELAELGRQRTRTMEAELRALRAQISPHFIYNSLAAIASFVRTDPDRARELLLEFADFTRYAFRRGGEFTTLAEELGNVERYLRWSRRGSASGCRSPCWSRPRCCRWRCPTSRSSRWWRTPSATGWRARTGAGHISITASDAGAEAEIVDRGRRGGQRPRAGARGPRRCGPAATASASATSTRGCARSSATTTVWWSRPPPAPGTRVILRVPKYAPGVHPSP